MSERACGYCGVVGVEFCRDHLIPQSRGGSDAPENCVMSCGPCNQAKSDSTPSEWMPDGLPPLIYERERRLSKKFAMKPKDRKRNDRAGWKFDERATAALLSIARALETPNESDSNCESPAGVTDGLYEVSRAIRFVGRVVARGQCEAIGHEWRNEYQRGRSEPVGSKCAWCATFKPTGHNSTACGPSTWLRERNSKGL